VEAAEGTPVLLPMADDLDLVERLDGIVIPGGADIHPRHYGRPIEGAIDLEDEDRIAFDRRLIERCLQLGLPVLAICYGAQLLNVHLGGTLHQTLPRRSVDHGAPGAATTHPVRLAAGSLLREAHDGLAELSLASAHRQAIADLGRGLKATAEAEDGVVEGVEHPGSVVGVQWHPESSTAGLGLFSFFVQRLARP
jgi:putative glutamine amidotransferase